MRPTETCENAWGGSNLYRFFFRGDMYLDVFRRQEATTTGNFYSNFQKVTDVEYSSATGTIAAAITSFASSVDADSLITDASGSAARSVLGVSSAPNKTDAASSSAAVSHFASQSSSAGSPDTVSPKWGYIIALTKKNQKVAKKFTVDCSGPTENGVFDPASYVKYLVEHIKVDGHLGNLGNDITVSQEGAAKVVVVSTTKFSGKYLKYLSKRYLKKNQIRDWIRFVSVKKNEYQLQFYSVAVDDEEDEE
ncbi:hypothetical protein KL921_004612 [Ogataea angusta]|uniref:Uncharacterized protein n=1 Tax=Pichia angusta TaxID=870730 RepID=A0AAN6DCH9_PICAN|nr:uncharacterized protein KL928_005001 [Ogataea angusta]KAG7806818.1 hypothetical protein KL921_004612 [Ogataea angusta]KAG7816035.1 hypothetical protein KL928_005001 [Ogataea angusta]KAG7821488.1 hypothetical protein KL909_004375 [Ogataea angusta]KAG7827228.1 hypothetical protein KL920_004888 [Ogataea angusta]KAG7835806.1 hypothetical protein KL942_004976 [Ogataea angusta]